MEIHFYIYRPDAQLQSKNGKKYAIQLRENLKTEQRLTSATLTLRHQGLSA